MQDIPVMPQSTAGTHCGGRIVARVRTEVKEAILTNLYRRYGAENEVVMNCGVKTHTKTFEAWLAEENAMLKTSLHEWEESDAPEGSVETNFYRAHRALEAKLALAVSVLETLKDSERSAPFTTYIVAKALAEIEAIRA